MSVDAFIPILLETKNIYLLVKVFYNPNVYSPRAISCLKPDFRGSFSSK